MRMFFLAVCLVSFEELFENKLAPSGLMIWENSVTNERRIIRLSFFMEFSPGIVLNYFLIHF